MVPCSGGGGRVSDVLCAAGGGWSARTCLQDRASGCDSEAAPAGVSVCTVLAVTLLYTSIFSQVNH